MYVFIDIQIEMNKNEQILFFLRTSKNQMDELQKETKYVCKHGFGCGSGQLMG